MTNEMKLTTEYQELSAIVKIIKDDIFNHNRQIQLLITENELYRTAGMAEVEVDWLCVHNRDDVQLIKGKISTLNIKLSYVEGRVKDIKPLI